MRIHLVGNICNNHYVYAKFLRRRGVDAHLFYASDAETQQQPSSEDPELLVALPEWCHAYTAAEVGNPLAPRRAFLDALGACDLLQVQDVGLIWAAMTSRPFVWQPYGWDLYKMPFADGAADAVLGDPVSLAMPALMRRAIPEASAILLEWWFECWVPGYRLIEHLGGPARVERIPIGMDATKFSPGPARPLSELLGSEGPPDEPGLILFHPTRQLFAPGGAVYFGNDILYRALGRLHSDGLRFTLVVVEKGNADEALAKELIRQVGIEGRVRWIPAMPRHRLVDWYRSADITVAELAGGSFGSVGTEALACGSPLLGNFLLESDEPTFWSPPIPPPMMNVSTEGDIVAALTHHAGHREELGKLGVDGRRWVEANLAGERVAEQLEALYESILRGAETGSSVGHRAPIGGVADGDMRDVLGTIASLLSANGTDVPRREVESALLSLACEVAAERAHAESERRSLRALVRRATEEVMRRRRSGRA